MQWKVAVVEDDRRLARAVTAGLRREGYQVRAAGSAEEGLLVVQAWRPDVILLDLMLPDNDGPELFARFRNLTGAALVGMTARSMLADVVAGLRLGADDYITKPFAMEELSARVAALIRRLHGAHEQLLEVGDLTVDLSGGIAHRGENQLQLTATEFRILALLASRPGKIVSQSQIASAVWPTESCPESNAVEVHVARLRRKLDEGGAPPLLHTVRGMGYTVRNGSKR
jgi:two-component system, OmpR family, response regulator